MQEQLLGHLLGALDDGEQDLVETRLKDDKAYRYELVRLRRRLEPLLTMRCAYEPPPGLAARTCRFVSGHPRQPVRRPVWPQGSRRQSRLLQQRSMNPQVAPPSRVSGVRWLDVAVAVSIFLAASLVIIPAIHSSRFQSRMAACQDNLRELGRALTDFSDRHGGHFPEIPTESPLATAGIYAPILLQEGLLTNARRVVCPDSPLAEGDKFRAYSLDELQAMPERAVAGLRDELGGSYGYHLGHVQDGVYRATLNLGRATFALMADAPGRTMPGLQSPHHGDGGQNVLFENGRVQFVNCFEATFDGDDFFSNDAGVVAAGLHRDDAVIGSSATPPIVYTGGQ